MVFESLKLKLLDAQLKRARTASGKQTEAARKRIASINREEKKKAKILKEKLKVEKEKQKLEAAIKKAKKLNLTPTEKKILIQKKKAKAKKAKELQDSAVKVGKGIAKATGATARFLGQFVETNEQPKKRTSTKRKKSTKKSTKKTSKKKKSVGKQFEDLFENDFF